MFKRLTKIKVVEKTSKYFDKVGTVASYDEDAKPIIYAVWFADIKETSCFKENEIVKL